MKRENPFPLKYIIMTSSVILIFILLITVWLNQRIEKTLLANFQTSANTQIEILDKSINQFLNAIYSDIEMIASFPSVRGVGEGLSIYTEKPERTHMNPENGSEEEQHLYEILSIYGNSHKGTIYVYMATEYGGYLCWPKTDAIPHYDPRIRPWYKAGIEANGSVVQTAPYKDASSDRMLISNVKQISDDQGQVKGVVGIDASVDQIANVVNESKVANGGFFLLIHASEYILADTSNTANNFKTLKEVYPEVSNQYQKNVIFNVSIKGEEFLGTSKTIDGTQWRMMVLSPKNKIYAAMRSSVQNLVFGTIFGVIGIAIILFGGAYMLYYNRTLQKMVSVRTRDLQEMIDELIIKEQNLRLSEARYSSLVDNIPGVVFRCEPQSPWKMYTISNWVEVLSGYPAEMFLGETPELYWADLIYPEDIELVNKIKATDDEIYYSSEYRIISKDGSIKWVFERGGLIKNDHQVAFMDGVIFDITDQKRTEQEIQKLYEEMEIRVEERTKALKDAMTQLIEQEKMASLGGIVSGVAHEINTPLGIGVTISSYLGKITAELEASFNAGNLSKNKLKEFIGSNLESLGILETNLARAADLVNSFKKISVNQSTEEMTTFNLNDYFNMILLSLKHEYKNKDFEIAVECDPEIKIFSYPGVYSQIFTNFLMNSFIHGFKGRDSGKIVIKAALLAAENRLVITYKDNGLGIPPEVLDRVFEPFYTTNRANGGSGLGLYIVYNLVGQKLNGFINCHSTVGEGTTFVLDVPIFSEPAIDYAQVE